MDIRKLVISIIVSFLPALSGVLFPVGTWYAELAKPWFNPPNWVFGPVWSILYLLMGISLYMVWMKNLTIKAAIFFGTQLVLNALWTALFFGAQMLLISFLEIVLLWISIILTIYHFHKAERYAAYLLIPYLLWVTFAGLLNLSIYLLN